MKTVLIYGVPGVGKLTVANELSRITGFPVLHNHLFNDFVASAMEFGTPAFWKIVHTYRLDLIRQAAIEKRKGIILTIFYAGPSDDASLRDIVRRARERRGKIVFVHLICDEKELMKRVMQGSRKAFRKVKTRRKLREIIGRPHIDTNAEVPYSPNFVLDNTAVPPRRAAKLIGDHYRL